MKAQKNQETLIQHATVEDATASQTTRPLEGSKILYILVQDDPEPGAKEGEQGPCHRYTRPLLTSTLQLMGCKPRHAIKVCMNGLLFSFFLVLVERKEIGLFLTGGLFWYCQKIRYLSVLVRFRLGTLCSTLCFNLSQLEFELGR